jgi:hypothetical protein
MGKDTQVTVKARGPLVFNVIKDFCRPFQYIRNLFFSDPKLQNNSSGI